MLVASTAGAAVLGLLTMAPGAPAAGSASGTRPSARQSPLLQMSLVRARDASEVHIESVSAPVVLTAAQLQDAEAAAPPPAGPTTASSAPAARPHAPTSNSTASSSTASNSTASNPGSGPGSDLGTFTVTCYDIHGQTATGDEAGPQSAAVDPSVIPLGTHLYIDGVGYRVADDTGGAVQGHHIDIWESSYSACAAFGRQYRDVRQA